MLVTNQHSLFLLISCTVLSLAFSFSSFLQSSKYSKCKISMKWSWNESSRSKKSPAASNLEKQLISLLRSDSLSGRGAKASSDVSKQIDDLVVKLENAPDRLKSPTSSPLLDGCWRLLYTSSPGTNSPIQRSFTALDSVSIYQVVNVVDTSRSLLPGKQPDVSNTVCFGQNVRLRVTALGSTVSLS